MVKLEKTGKGEPDPKQKQLREHKKTFNKEVSLLIAQLIAFKRGMNGRGEPRAGIPPGDIKHPLPDEVGQYLDEMATRFEHIVTDAKGVIDEQEDYSSTRRKGRKELAEMVNSASHKSGLSKEASWWGAKTWRRIKNNIKAIRDKKLKIRNKMLKESIDVADKLLDLENSIVESNINAVPKSIYIMIQIRDEVFEISDLLLKMILFNDKESEIKEKIDNSKDEDEELKSNLPEPLDGKSKDKVNKSSLNKEEGEEEVDELDELDELDNNKSSWDPDIDWERIGDINNDFIKIDFVLKNCFEANLIDQETFISLNSEQNRLTKEYLSLTHTKKTYLESPEASKFASKRAKIYIEEYIKMVDTIGGYIGLVTNKKYDSFNSMFSDIREYRKKTVGDNKDINKLAHNWLTRTLRRYRLNIKPSSIDKMRLKCVGFVRELHEDVGNLQELIADVDNNDEEALKIAVSSINSKYIELANSFVSLGESHNAMYKEIRLTESKTEMKEVAGKSMSILKNMEKKFDIFNDETEEAEE